MQQKCQKRHHDHPPVCRALIDNAHWEPGQSVHIVCRIKISFFKKKYFIPTLWWIKVLTCEACTVRQEGDMSQGFHVLMSRVTVWDEAVGSQFPQKSHRRDSHRLWQHCVSHSQHPSCVCCTALSGHCVGICRTSYMIRWCDDRVIGW